MYADTLACLANPASVRSSYAAFSTLVNDWSAKVKRWRCSLSAADRVRLGCPDLTDVVGATELPSSRQREKWDVERRWAGIRELRRRGSAGQKRAIAQVRIGRLGRGDGYAGDAKDRCVADTKSRYGM